MTSAPSLARRLLAAIVVASALSAAGCATAPSHPVATPEPAPVAAPVPPPVVTMAPIPNPEGPKPPRAEHASSGGHSYHHASQHGASSTTTGVAAPATAAGAASLQPNPQQAARLRAAGLEQLNRGSIDRAVALLRHASQLDPTNELIKRDLDRATRIGRAVHAKR